MNTSIVFVCGSLRKESYNRKLMAIAMASAQELGAKVSEATIGDLSIYNEDIDVEPWPAPAKKFYDQIASADAVVIISPEYNYSIPGGLKNAIDWASRGKNAWKDKAIALMGVSMGQYGTTKMQMHLRQSLVAAGPNWIVPQPQVAVGPAKVAFKNDGTLADPLMVERIKTLLENLLATAKKMK
jgi:chromate reductase